MIRKIIIREEAFNDLDSNSSFLAEYSANASIRFLEAAQAAFLLIAEMPEVGTLRDYDNPALISMRMWPVPGFRKFLIFYIPTKNAIEIVRLLHGARNISAMFGPADE